MAQREHIDGNIDEDVIQFDDVHQLRFINMRPDYLILALIRDDDRSTLPEIHIPPLNPPMPRFYLGLVIRSVRELLQYSLTPGPEYNPLLSMLAWNADYWSVTFHASGDSLTAAFYPVYINPRPAERVETPMRESSTDDEQPGPSHQVNSSSGGSHMDGSRTDDEQPGPSHQANNSSEMRSAGSYMDGSRTDDEQPGPSRRANSSEIRSGGSRTPSDQSPGKSLEETHTDDEQPGPFHMVNNRSEIRSGGSTTPADQSSSSHDEMRQGIKRKRKTSGPHSPGLKRLTLDGYSNPACSK
ncbi:hypothetical protein F2P79_005810 [Pimephales promelas]|nr:hypothetical protein F2P79_005810 [Pimephales promelas]